MSYCLNSPLGLSPRVRRYPSTTSDLLGDLGSISTCAEVPRSAPAQSSRPTVYLHVCGGTSPSTRSGRNEGGLSPRVRRYPPRIQGAQERRRSISTCAEVPQSDRSAPPRPKVYLHVCGGTVSCSFTSWTVRGLSPRVRRYLVGPDNIGDLPRSISTCAEVPGQTGRERHHTTVYLHVCGGTPPPARWSCPQQGLSPRVRRYRVGKGPGPSSSRSISTCAEVPSTACFRRFSNEVYLHVCGGTLGLPLARAPTLGLSPRVRRYP